MFGMTVHASVDQRQQFQQLGVQEGIAFDGNRCVRTGVTAPAFSYCGGLRGNERMVTLSFASWNQLDGWLRQVERLRRAA